MGKFSGRESMKFIEMYAKYPFLWNPENKDYLNRELRTSTLQDMVYKMNIPGFTLEECRTKIKNLRTTYTQELNKVLSAKKRGSIYKPKLKWFDTLDRQIRKCVTLGKSFKMKEQSTDENFSLILFKGLEDATIEDNTEYIHAEHVQELSQDPFAEDNTVIHEFKTDPYCEKSQTSNEFDLFAMNIGSQLKSMPLENALRMQIKIQEIIADERVKLHRQQTSQAPK